MKRRGHRRRAVLESGLGEAGESRKRVCAGLSLGTVGHLAGDNRGSENAFGPVVGWFDSLGGQEPEQVPAVVLGSQAVQ